SASLYLPPYGPPRNMMRPGRPSVLGFNGLTQHTALPDRNSRLTPASRIALTLLYWRMSQYSSWATLKNALHFRPRPGALLSLFEQSVPSTPRCASQYASGNSKHSHSPEPTDCGLS